MTIRAALAQLSRYVIAALLLGGIVHVVIILTVPRYVEADAFKSLTRFGPDRQFNILPPVKPGSEPLPQLDPAMQHAICRFNLENGPVELTADVRTPYWSLGVFNGAGLSLYSLNNRTSGNGRLEVLILSPKQLSVLRERPPENLEDLIVVETEENEAFALLRAYVPDRFHAAQVTEGLKASFCGSLPARTATSHSEFSPETTGTPKS